jgi:hypothetical protein
VGLKLVQQTGAFLQEGDVLFFIEVKGGIPVISYSTIGCPIVEKNRVFKQLYYYLSTM